MNHSPRRVLRATAIAFGVGAFCLVLLGACASRQNAAPQGLLGSYNVPCYTSQGGDAVVASSGCTYTFESGASVAFENGSTVTGVVTNDLDGAALILDPAGNSNLRAISDSLPIVNLGGTPTAAAFAVKNSAGTPVAVIHGHGELSALSALRVAPGSALAGVASTAVAPSALLQPIAMATAGTVPVTIPPTGQVVCIYNTGSETVTIADTGNQILSASGALGQYDVLCGFSDGTRFIEFARSNN